MKIRVLSDLHLEFHDWNPPPAPADVVVLAGDIHVGSGGIEWGRRRFPDAHIIYVPGNHEFYGSEMHAMLAQLRATAKANDVHFLDGDRIEIDGVRFLGATLWTDFAIYGSDPHTLERAMQLAALGMHDYRIIRFGDDRKLAPSDTREIHRTQRAWLAEQLALPFGGATVVVTHHLPHRQSIHRRYANDSLNPGFASDLADLVRAPVSLWIHGHTHESLDYRIDQTRVVCNPRGYIPHEPNLAFDPIGVFEVPLPQSA